jgi:pimeloyl-ACP methyl ester carboxylesterase
MWGPLISRLKLDPKFEEGEAEWLLDDHGARLFTLGHASRFSRNLKAKIDAKWEKAQGYEDIILIGHSLGGLFVRQAFLIASGADPDEPGSSDWSRRVSRIVLFAGINRGIRTESTHEKKFLLRRLVAFILRTVPHPHFLFEDTLQGSGFVSNLRINWIRQFSSVNANPPDVVQVLGTSDKIVENDDSRDVLSFRRAVEISIPNATHGDLYRIDNIDNLEEAEDRYALLKKSIGETLDFSAHGTNEPDPHVNCVVFVLHGIKASNNREWVTNIAVKIKDRDQEHIKVQNPEYGYFSAISFALPERRRRKIRFFQDCYTETLARYPNAEFNFIGHSNGTYILGQSLRRLSGMRFRNIVLAGSVLPTDYPWDDLVSRGQVQRIRNDMSNRDWPVGILCSALRGIWMRDIGTGGFDGFNGSSTERVAYYQGSHSKPLDGSNLDSLIEFALSGKIQKSDELVSEPGYYRTLSHAAPYILLSLLGAGIFASYQFVLQGGHLSIPHAIAELIGLFAAYVALDL